VLFKLHISCKHDILGPDFKSGCIQMIRSTYLRLAKLHSTRDCQQTAPVKQLTFRILLFRICHLLS